MKTQKIKDFITKNKSLKIVFGERLTPEGKTICTADDMKRSDRVLYRFSDGTNMTLTIDDLRSAPKFNPKWDI